MYDMRRAFSVNCKKYESNESAQESLTVGAYIRTATFFRAWSHFIASSYPHPEEDIRLNVHLQFS